MSERVKLSRLQERFETFTYPLLREDLATQLEGTIVEYADGEAVLGRLVSQCDSDMFRSAEDVTADLQNHLPIESVGEPGQSEGDA